MLHCTYHLSQVAKSMEHKSAPLILMMNIIPLDKDMSKIAKFVQIFTNCVHRQNRMDLKVIWEYVKQAIFDLSVHVLGSYKL